MQKIVKNTNEAFETTHPWSLFADARGCGKLNRVRWVRELKSGKGEVVSNAGGHNGSNFKVDSKRKQIRSTPLLSYSWGRNTHTGPILCGENAKFGFAHWRHTRRRMRINWMTERYKGKVACVLFLCGGLTAFPLLLFT